MTEPATHVLTGAASGIGRVLAERLVARGDRVVAVVRSERRVEELGDQLPGLAAVLVCDLAEPGSVASFAEGLVGGRPSLRRIDSLLHVAGVVDLAPVAEFDLRAWQRQLDVNLTAPAVLTSALLPSLRKARGTVVFVNSGAGLSAHPNWAGYAAAKFGLRALADALRAEERDHGVRVASVYPGRTATPMQEKVHGFEGREYDAGRWIRPETVAEAIVRIVDLPEDATISELTIQAR